MTKNSINAGLSVVIPVYNEARHLFDNVCRFIQVLDSLVGRDRWEIQLVNNGSTDDSANIINRLSVRFPSISETYLSSPNYGLAIRHGIQNAKHTYVYVVDLDQWDDAFIRWSWCYRNSYDLIISSKRADPSINRQSRIRFVLSWGLNALLQLLFSFPGSDTHGQKLLNSEVLSQILEDTRADRGQYDVELVIRTIRASKRVIELPVPYIEMRPSRNTLFRKILWNMWALSKLAWRLRSVECYSVELRRISRSDVEQARGFVDN